MLHHTHTHIHLCQPLAATAVVIATTLLTYCLSLPPCPSLSLISLKLHLMKIVPPLLDSHTSRIRSFWYMLTIAPIIPEKRDHISKMSSISEQVVSLFLVHPNHYISFPFDLLSPSFCIHLHSFIHAYIFIIV